MTDKQTPLGEEHPTESVDLTRGNYKRQLIKLATPIIGTSFIQVAYTFTDMAWVGHLGSRQLAAVSSAGVLIWLGTTFGMMTKIGAEAFVAQAVGAKDPDRAKLYVRHNVSLALLLALVLVGVFLPLGGMLLSFYHLDEDIFHLARSYLSIAIFGFVPQFLAFALTGSYNASGFSHIPFKINTIGLLGNMILDPLLIYGLKWGTDGAALATVLAQFTVLICFMVQLRFGKKLLGGGFKLLGRLRRLETLQILKLGLPITLLNALFSIISYVMGGITSRAGSHIGLVVINTGGQLEAISWNTSQGLSTALTSFVGQNYAAREIPRLWSGYRFLLRVSLLLGVLTTVLYYLGGEGLFSLIVKDPGAISEGGRYFRVSAFSQVFMMAEITTQGLFYGTGRSVIPSSISILGNLLRVPLAILLLSFGWGLTGIWISISFTAFLKGIVALSFLPWLRRRINKSGSYSFPEAT